MARIPCSKTRLNRPGRYTDMCEYGSDLCEFRQMALPAFEMKLLEIMKVIF